MPEVHQRLGFYKRLSQAPNTDALHDLELELQDRFGRPPTEVQNLIALIQIKQLLRKHHVKSLIAGPERTSLDASSEAKLSPDRTLALVAKHPKTYSITPDSKIIIRRHFSTVGQLFLDVEKLLSELADAC